MAITAAQRTVALNEIFTKFSDPGALALLIPGLTQATVVSFIQTAIGTTADAQLTEALNSMVAAQQSQLTAEQAQVTTTQTNITDWTVA